VDIAVWLRDLGLPQYERAFRDNDIGEELLPTLTEADLREIGVASLGHRKQLLAAIARLAATADARPPTTPPAASNHAPAASSFGDPPAARRHPQAAATGRAW